jgi:predicted enzyme related to lactoylglutathione lyase
MIMADYTHGRFVWRDLLSTNLDAAKRFYGELFGWTTKEFPGPSPYYVLQAGEKMVGGMMPVQKGESYPSFWMSYVSVSDVDACADRAKNAGGKIHRAPTDIPTVGRFAIIGDPNGATTAAFKSVNGDPKQVMAAGEFCWESLQTPNPTTDVDFYKKVYGWSEEKFGDAITLGVSEGMMNQVASVGSAQGGMPASWTTYVGVDSLSSARDRVKRLGGSILEEAIPVPTMGTFAVIQDPDKAVICLFEAEKR